MNYENDNDFIEREEFLMNKEYEIIEMVSKLRKEKGLSQDKLCSLIGMKQTSLARLERGGVSPGIDTLLKILYPLGYTIEVKRIKK